jgi:hypothetical protein
MQRPTFKSGRFATPDVIADPRTQTFVHDDHKVDFFSRVNPETGLVEQVPIAATEEEKRAVERRSLQRALESVDARLAALDLNDVMPWEEPLTDVQVARKRAGLEAEREHVLAKIAELEPPAEPEKRTPRR